MAIRLSKGLTNYYGHQGSIKHALTGGKLHVYTGSQPATPEAAPSGTLLNTYTASSGAHTAEVLATGSVTLATGGSGSVDTITVDSVDLISASVPFNVSLAQTALDCITAINKSSTSPKYIATSGGSAVIILTASRGAGTEANGLIVSATGTTITFTTANMSGGVDSANGLKFGTCVGGVLSQDAAQTWSGTGIATGTAGWFRYVGSVADSGVADSTESQIRIDGSISTSGADWNMLPSTTITATAPHLITGFSITIPS